MAYGSCTEESILGAVFEFAPQGIIAIDSSGTIQFANRMAEQLYGYSSMELAERPFEMLVPARRRDGYRASLLRCFAQSQSGPVDRGMEVVGLRKDGTEFPMQLFRSREGPLMISFVKDITERKRLEQERDCFFDLSPDVLCIFGMDGRIRRANPAFLRKLGYTMEELLSAPAGAFVHPEDHQRSTEQWYRLFAGQDLANFDSRYICKDGSILWFEWTAPAPNPDDPVIYAAGRDITEAKQLEEERDRLVALIENSSDYIGVTTPDGSRNLYVNQAGRDLLALPDLERLRKMSLSDIQTERNASVMEVVEEALKRDGRSRREGVLYHYSTGDPIPMDFNSFVISDRASGKPLAWATIARDIRERKRTEERLHALTGQLFRILGDERSRIARELHDDITQKLAALGIDLGIILEEIDPGIVSEQLVSLHEQLLGLSEDVRQIAYRYHPAILQHSGLVAALHAHCREVSRQTAIRVDFSSQNVLSPLSPEISSILYRIAQEALRNVAKHSGATLASVVLACFKSPGGGSKLRLSVIDNGWGFLVNEVKKGAGLGLLSIEELARLVDGAVTINSVPEEGTRVEVEVPLPDMSL